MSEIFYWTELENTHYNKRQQSYSSSSSSSNNSSDDSFSGLPVYLCANVYIWANRHIRIACLRTYVHEHVLNIEGTHTGTAHTHTCMLVDTDTRAQRNRKSVSWVGVRLSLYHTNIQCKKSWTALISDGLFVERLTDGSAWWHWHLRWDPISTTIPIDFKLSAIKQFYFVEKTLFHS